MIREVDANAIAYALVGPRAELQKGGRQYWVCSGVGMDCVTGFGETAEARFVHRLWAHLIPLTCDLWIVSQTQPPKKPWLLFVNLLH
jgi:hypothetical protein